MKVRKQGNSLMVEVPRDFGIKNGTQVVAIKGRNGSWSYVPKLKNPFQNPHTSFPHPHELTVNDATTKREDI